MKKLLNQKVPLWYAFLLSIVVGIILFGMAQLIKPPAPPTKKDVAEIRFILQAFDKYLEAEQQKAEDK